MQICRRRKVNSNNQQCRLTSLFIVEPNNESGLVLVSTAGRFVGSDLNKNSPLLTGLLLPFFATCSLKLSLAVGRSNSSVVYFLCCS